jgi:hypothetical protein
LDVFYHAPDLGLGIFSHKTGSFSGVRAVHGLHGRYGRAGRRPSGPSRPSCPLRTTT